MWHHFSNFHNSLTYFRYITAIGAKNETEVLDLRQLLLGDAELKQTVDLVRVTYVVRLRDENESDDFLSKVCRVLEANSAGAWGSFMGFREVLSISLRITPSYHYRFNYCWKSCHYFTVYLEFLDGCTDILIGC